MVYRVQAVRWWLVRSLIVIKVGIFLRWNFLFVSPFYLVFI